MAIPNPDLQEQRIARLEAQIEKLKAVLQATTARADAQQALLEQHELHIQVLRAQASVLNEQN